MLGLLNSEVKLNNLTLPSPIESRPYELKVTTIDFSATSAFCSALTTIQSQPESKYSPNFDMQYYSKLAEERYRRSVELHERIETSLRGVKVTSAVEALQNAKKRGLPQSRGWLAKAIFESRKCSEEFSASNLTMDKLSPKVFDRLVAVKGRRKFSIKTDMVKGVTLEISSSVATVTVQSTGNQRCRLGQLDRAHFTEGAVKSLVDRYVLVFKKLERRPTTEEYRLHSQIVTTVGDMLKIHIEFNVRVQHGKGSEEDSVLESLERLHLSKHQHVTHKNRRVEGICILNESLSGLTPARFSTYMQAYEEQPGTHDKILTRLKAAFNYCNRNNLLEPGKFFLFCENVKRQSEPRHVSVDDADLRAMSNYLLPDNFSSERMYREFKLFMHLEMTGHFRTQQTVTLKYSQIDFQNQVLRTTAKGGKKITLHLSKESCEIINTHRVWQESNGIFSDCLFPSPFDSKVPRANFENEWTKMRLALGFYDEESGTYKYRLHDFRETLLTRIDDLPDPILSKLLGHTSGQALRHYREAQAKNARVAAELAQERLNGTIFK